jgi:hypothetical protein
MGMNVDLTEGSYWGAWSMSSAAKRTNSTGGTVNTTIAVAQVYGAQSNVRAAWGRLNAAQNVSIKWSPFAGGFGASAAFPSTIGEANVSQLSFVGEDLIFRVAGT